ncbi:hypothetical protein ES705_39416 [subsurface metagenome]
MKGRKQCERKATYWFIIRGLAKQHACTEHMEGLLRVSRRVKAGIPFGKLEAGEKRRCGKMVEVGK